MTRQWLIDSVERVALTFLEAFAAALLLGGQFDLSTAHAAALGGVGAALAVAKSIIAARFGGNLSPASLVSAPDQP